MSQLRQNVQRETKRLRMSVSEGWPDGYNSTGTVSDHCQITLHITVVLFPNLPRRKTLPFETDRENPGYSVRAQRVETQALSFGLTTAEGKKPTKKPQQICWNTLIHFIKWTDGRKSSFCFIDFKEKECETIDKIYLFKCVY